MRPLILVVDDITDNREMYMEYLQFVGFRVAGAKDGASAIAQARELRPSIILMDFSLPVIDGWEATQILKADPTTRDIAIVGLTGHAEPAFRTRAALVGCDLFIAKPCSPAEVADHVVRILSRRRVASR